MISYRNITSKEIMISLSKINFSNMKGNNQIMEHDLNKALEKIEKAKQTMDQQKKLITSLVSISETTAGHSLDVLKRMDTSVNRQIQQQIHHLARL
jgi:hypothetical protein